MLLCCCFCFLVVKAVSASVNYEGYVCTATVNRLILASGVHYNLENSSYARK